jgi:ribonuclease P protein subunit RPR2
VVGRRNRGRARALAIVEKALDFAFKTYMRDPERARDAVRLAIKVAQKKRLRLPLRLRRKFCRKCATPFVGSSTFSVRVRGDKAPHVVLRCKVCRFTRRFHI